VEAPGIENDKRCTLGTIKHENGSIGVRAVSANVSDRAIKCAIDRGAVTVEGGAHELTNVVETALAKALVLAAAAKRWDVVVLIAEELRRRHDALAADLLFRRHVG
jgi:hypothetical protein